MKRYELKHLADATLIRNLSTLVSQHRRTTAELLAHIAEVGARRLYAPAGYPSMFAYCVRELRLSEDETWKRIQAARAAREFPAIFDLLAEGRLHLTAIVLLAPHLEPESADALLAAATHKSRRQIEALLAARSPKPDVPTRVRPVAASVTTPVQLVPEPVGLVVNSPAAPLVGPGATPAAGDGGNTGAPTTSAVTQLVPEPVGIVRNPASAPLAGSAGPTPAGDGGTLAVSTPPAAAQLVPEPVRAIARASDRPRVAPLAPERYAVQFTMSRAAHDQLRRAQELLGHALPSGDVAQVFERALDALVAQLEKRKFAATDKPRLGRGSSNSRTIPAQVKRAVWQRDGGRCTFVSAAGHRCEARKLLEYDHVQEIANGGASDVSNLRLRCRAHNQYAAECTFGEAFMRQRRGAAAGGLTPAAPIPRT